MAALSWRGRKTNLSHLQKGRGSVATGCLACWSAGGAGDTCQGDTSCARWPESRSWRVTDILTGAGARRVFYANGMPRIMNRIIFSSSESFSGKDTWISQKSPHRGIKKMFYSFMMQTLSCVQILSFHCLCYLKEEQTAGSSLDASIED